MTGLKWLECRLTYRPDDNPSRNYIAAFEDQSGRTITFKTSEDYVYIDSLVEQPPLAPFGSNGFVVVEHEGSTGSSCLVSFQGKTSSGNRTAIVQESKLRFVPPTKKKSHCFLKKLNDNLRPLIQAYFRTIP